MLLNVDQIRAISHGALSVFEENGEICLRRFTAEAQEYYRRTQDDFYRKSFATAGIRLEFMTDSNTLSFSYHTRHASSRRFYYFDIYVDGVMVEHFGHENVSEARSNFRMALPEGTHTVCVYLPALAEATLYDVALDDGAMCAPVSRPLKLLCYGDSITQGYDAKYSSSTYVNILADKLHAEVVDEGIGGEHFCPDLLDAKIPYSPDIITVAYGTNDWSNQPREATIRKANDFYAKLRALYPAAQIFAITPLWRADNERVTHVGLFGEIREIVRNAAEKVGAVVIDGDRMIPHLADVCSDRYLHPNDIGFRFYANNLYNAMLPHLKED